jgi:short-subunit dehydrogenase
MSKKIWITGASSGIGAALARELSAQGHQLLISARRIDALEAVRVTCAFPEKINCMSLDLENPESHRGIADQAWELMSYIDVVIHNAGVSQRSLAHETDWRVDERLMRINYLGTVSLTKALLGRMLDRGQGQFVVVTSLTGIIPSPYRSGYAAAKHALHGFFDSLRAELEDRGILVTLVAPGFVKTQVSVNAFTGNGSALGVMDQAQAKGISAERCAQVIVKAMHGQKREVYVGRESYAAYVKRYLPGLFARMIKKAKVR